MYTASEIFKVCGAEEELYAVLDAGEGRAAVLLEKIDAGQIDGSHWCMKDELCVYGTLYRAEMGDQNVSHETLLKAFNVQPEGNRAFTPLENFVINIRPGHTAENNVDLAVLRASIARWQNQ